MSLAKSQRSFRWYDYCLAIVQVIVLYIAMLQRMTSTWIVVAFTILALLHSRRATATVTAISRRRYWAVAISVLVIFSAVHLHLRWATHPGASANGYTSGHNFWFTMFEDLQNHQPEWKTRFAARYKNKSGDELVEFAWRDYLARHPEEWPRWNPNRTDPFQVGITQVGIEALCRKTFLEFFRNHPKFVLETWTYYNTRGSVLISLMVFRAVSELVVSGNRFHSACTWRRFQSDNLQSSHTVLVVLHSADRVFVFRIDIAQLGNDFDQFIAN